MDTRSKLGLAVAILLALLGAGCSASKSKSSEEPASSTSAASPSGPGIDLNCVYDSLQNPTESFHYVYKKDSDTPVHQEADVTPQTIDGFFMVGSEKHEFHGTKSDLASWRQALAGVTGISGMSSTIALIHSSEALKREGDEKVNGYDTIKYSIDTARGDSAEQGLYKATLGSGGFEKGNAWVTAKGCPVKIELDTEMHNNSGADIDKVHYSEAMVKK
jgi:hypothetical protein